jgi:phosphate transport system substrate-binding protein
MSRNLPAALLPVLSIALVIGVTSCQAPTKEVANSQPEPTQSDNITIDGSETVFPISEIAVKEFQNSKNGKVAITIDAVGTGKGIDRFCRGKIDIANVSRPLSNKELVICKSNGIDFLELPIAYDAVSVVIHPNNNWAKTLTLAELKKIWEPAAQGKIINWKDIRPNFPDTPLRIFAIAANSGTYDYFTKVINGKAKLARNDVTSVSDTKAIIKGIANDVDAIGFISYVHASTNKDDLQTVGIDSGKGAIFPSLATVNNGTYAPLARPLFIYVSTKSFTKPNMQEFVNYYLVNANKFATKLHYIPLSTSAYAKIQQQAKELKVGSVFGGKEVVNLKVEDFTTKIAK